MAKEKTQISTSVPPVVREWADELVKTRYGTMSALLTALITAEHTKYGKKVQMHTVRKSDKGTWWVVDPEGGFVAEFTTKWEADDFADELNGQS